MIRRSMTTEEALRVLRTASPHQDIRTEDARRLVQPVMILASHEPREVVGLVGEALLAHEMESLIWQPLEAVRLILVLIEWGSPSKRLLELALNYLSMYFQELDEVVEGCRGRIQAGEPLSNISVALSSALNQMEGVRSADGGS